MAKRNGDEKSREEKKNVLFIKYCIYQLNSSEKSIGFFFFFAFVPISKSLFSSLIRFMNSRSFVWYSLRPFMSILCYFLFQVHFKHFWLQNAAMFHGRAITSTVLSRAFLGLFDRSVGLWFCFTFLFLFCSVGVCLCVIWRWCSSSYCYVYYARTTTQKTARNRCRCVVATITAARHRMEAQKIQFVGEIIEHQTNGNSFVKSLIMLEQWTAEGRHTQKTYGRQRRQNKKQTELWKRRSKTVTSYRVVCVSSSFRFVWVIVMIIASDQRNSLLRRLWFFFTFFITSFFLPLFPVFPFGIDFLFDFFFTFLLVNWCRQMIRFTEK